MVVRYNQIAIEATYNERTMMNKTAAAIPVKVMSYQFIAEQTIATQISNTSTAIRYLFDS